MKVSLNTVKQYTDVDISVDELVTKINAQLGGVEAVIDLGARYEKATIAKIVKCEKHPNADKLSVCEIDAGTGENIQVVCGAPNVREGLFVVWLPPGSTVPASFADKAPFVLEARELRGVVSNGMLASAKELGIGESHDGILEIDPNEWKPSDVEIKPGTSFARAYGLDDTIIDIENKMFTHRPDLFGQLGVAREIAGIQHKQFTSPDWYKKTVEFGSGEGLKLEVRNDTPEIVPRFMAVAIKNVVVKPSPLWLQAELVRLGSKPISNIVDVTNYIMLLTGQPLHAYDYDKVATGVLGARAAKQGETIALLSGKTIQLDESDMVITDGQKSIGLAGVMGGAETEVSADTKNIILECATFDMYTVRKTSMRHGIFTDAVTRYNKGQSPLQNPNVLHLAMQSIVDTAGGEEGSEVVDNKNLSAFEEKYTRPITLNETFINSRLGLTLGHDEIRQLLENVECIVGGETDSTITPPFWRTDLELAEDIVEEVGRLYGFDKLPHTLPRRSIKPAPRNADRVLAQKTRDRLSRAGANEVLTYSFVHENIIKQAGQDSAQASKLSNALSPDLQYYRLSLTPSLLNKVHMNIKAGFDGFAIFERNKVHFKGEMDPDEPNIPHEDEHIGLVIAHDDKQKPSGSPYYHALKYLGQITKLEAAQLVPLASFDLAKDEWGRQLTAPYEPHRSAIIVKDDEIWGVVGEYKRSVKRAFKLPDFTAGFEVHQAIITEPEVVYAPLSKYPGSERDICFQVARSTPYADVVRVAAEAANHETIDCSIQPVDIYQPDVGDTKNITLRLTFTSQQKTLSGDEVTALVKAVTDRVVAELSAVVI
ncbi:MAG: Phenylalanine-tRNA ligase beta subunit [Candidatus Saccharibacteria bacterium]|nr:Phenylalanine-tRNA ligase beta subunit [Candidatus Saccharibacteria bacterium]